MNKSTTKKRVAPIAVTPEQRYHIISDAAYFRNLKHRQDASAADDEIESWREVEAEVDEVLRHHRLR